MHDFNTQLCHWFARQDSMSNEPFTHVEMCLCQQFTVNVFFILVCSIQTKFNEQDDYYDN